MKVLTITLFNGTIGYESNIKENYCMASTNFDRFMIDLIDCLNNLHNEGLISVRDDNTKGIGING